MDDQYLWSPSETGSGPLMLQPEELAGLGLHVHSAREDDEEWDDEEDWEDDDDLEDADDEDPDEDLEDDYWDEEDDENEDEDDDW